MTGHQTRPANVFVLDVDGVLTDPGSGAVNPEVIQAVAADLKAGIPVAFNTGRSTEWLEDRIFPLLADLSPGEFGRLLAVCEKGAVVSSFPNGRLQTYVDRALTPPDDFRAWVKALLDQDQGGWKLSDSMFWDGTKLTMISIERRPGVALQEYHEAQAVLDSLLERMIDKHKLTDFKVDATVIATDVEHKLAGKHRGAEAVLRWLGRHDIHPQAFTAIGDSPSDAAMAEALAQAGPTTFVYVGNPDTYAPGPQVGFKTVITGGGNAADTAKYLAA